MTAEFARTRSAIWIAISSFPLAGYPKLAYWVLKSFLYRRKMRGIKPVKPEKAFIITLTKMSLSLNSAKRTLETAALYGEEGNVEIFDAIDRFEAERFLADNGLKWDHDKDIEEDMRSIVPAAMGCFASHFALWRRCVELGKPIIIMEHDAFFTKPIPDIRFRDVVYLSGKLSHVSSYDRHARVFLKKSGAKGGEFFYPFDYFYGTDCYAVTPEGAKKLIQASRNGRVSYTDKFMCKDIVDIAYYSPPVFGLDHSFTTIWDEQLLQRGEGEFITREEAWEIYQRENDFMERT